MYGILGGFSPGLKGISWMAGIRVPFELHSVDGVYIEIPLGRSESVNTRRAELQLAKALEDSGLEWISRRSGKWIFDCDQFYKEFTKAPRLQWLQGLIEVSPDVDVEFKPQWPDLSRAVVPCTTAKFVIVEEGIVPVSPSRIDCPVEISESLKRLLADYPNPKSVGFVMMSFADDKAHTDIHKAIVATLDLHGLKAVRADTRTYHDDLFSNVQTYMHGCGFGIAVFERMNSENHNPNVALELGYMLALRKPVLILKDKMITALQADVVGRLYAPFDTRNPLNTIRESVSKWLSSRGLVGA
jgi:hypothetical protein